jgi:hypothetical protein
MFVSDGDECEIDKLPMLSKMDLDQPAGLQLPMCMCVHN